MTTAPCRPSWRRDPLLLALVGPPVVGAVATLVVQLYLATWGGVVVDAGWVLSLLLFCLWALLPFAAAVAVGVCVHRHWRGGSWVALLGGLLLVAVTGWGLWNILTSDSSTAVLGFIFAPFVQAAVAGLTMGAAVGVATLRRRRKARTV